ncbi:hypothetical protein J7E79_02945 [Bacillus sp. ISL-40]|uniref:hypothetical protein n=1 Tax=unclassified Bacillus (in: firmicutes) TaxID=185979 RepID=UPI001BE98162|nr:MULTISPECIES: hypothetical protein [unclassified Bacillus (in: firmicutes)]MBT2696394.1 hypothetical protein [Bacillus sp. ISL-40]MBT2741590.1 hypothetical protein [Bacillus sp. ISL-77]
MNNESQTKVRPLTKRIGKYTCEVYSVNEPSPEAIKNTNREINRLMNKKFTE